MMFDYIFSYLVSAVKRKTIPNVWKPKTLTDKILKIKISPNYSKANLRSLVSDRQKVRHYISSKNTNCKLIPLIWSGEEFDRATFDSLPEKFVIKANHGSKMVRIVNKNKAEDCFESIEKEVIKWKDIDYYKKGREWVYKNTPKTIIVEEFIDFKNDVPPDYKFFCLNGKVAFVQVDLDRYKGHSRNIYDAEFKRLPVKYQFEPGYDIEKPALFDEAIDIAKKLSNDFDFIRVDLYILDEDIYFGELTNFPGNCLETFSPIQFDHEMGRLLTLEK